MRGTAQEPRPHEDNSIRTTRHVTRNDGQVDRDMWWKTLLKVCGNLPHPPSPAVVAERG
jgi:hypothetical protein